MKLTQDNGYTKILKDSSDAPISNTDEVITGSFPAGANITQTLLYFFDIPASGSITPTLIKDGVYTDTFGINVYEGSDPLVAGPTPVTSSVVTATATVPKLIQMSMVSTGGAFDGNSPSRSINFGALAPGQFNTFDLRVYTNAGFSVSFSSSNNGVLRKPAATSGPGVPYLFYANGSLLDLSNSAAVPVVGITASGQTNLQGLGYPIRIQIGSFSTALLVGGPAQDVILVTATTTE